MSRIYATTRASTCGCCRRPVHVLETSGSVTLVELLDGRRVPHACPDPAVRRWERLETLARLARAGRQPRA